MAETNAITELTKALIQNISQMVIGKNEKVLQALTCLVADGHLLLEDLPGVGKTTLAKAIAMTIKADYKRVQCTPDLMPSDITGVTIFNQQKGEFEFVKGSVFTNILLADEINRTSPRTQSALLEAMSDATVSIDNQTYTLPSPFFVMATQNPIEFSGTYDLPEAQMDRFMMRISLGYPDKNSTVNMLRGESQAKSHSINALISVEQVLKLRKHRERVNASEEICKYIATLVEQTRQHPAIRVGASPRAAISLLKAAQAYALLTGSTSVTPAHIAKLAEPVLGHRLLFKNQHLNQAERIEFFAALLKQDVRVPDNPINEATLSVDTDLGSELTLSS